MPDRFVFVRHRMRFGAGEGREVDVLGAAGIEIWVCQSKWRCPEPVEGWVEQRVGVDVLRALEAQGTLAREEMKEVDDVRLWLFAHDGLSREAEEYAAECGVLWSAREEFDALLSHLGLRPLPRVTL